ncbi:hypothetical protein [Saccharopolyspora sp. ASAGF58]|uniref:hypothetical protein n=1 Tax=Saccharopolyspora sp. ASAGF58 TaxID=2719023 RepID=UPI00143FEA79|nr:hypothetical protein [Saccharopolyspora sp. ASAGF58]QIZ35465.1 hypothetical protein FDZ84_13115 [Saccharopolyspora sp. ASAGF58]
MLEKVVGFCLAVIAGYVVIIGVVAQARLNSGEFYYFGDAFATTSTDAGQILADVGEWIPVH